MSSGFSGFDADVAQRMPQSPGRGGVSVSPSNKPPAGMAFLGRLTTFRPVFCTEKTLFMSVPLKWLCPDTRLSFGIYSRSGTRMKPILSPGQVFLPEHRQGIENNADVFIKSVSSSELIYYLDNNLDTILGHAGLALSEKAELFYYLAFKRIKQVYTRPSKEGILGLKDIIAMMIEYIFSNRTATKRVFGLMRSNACSSALHPVFTFAHALNVGIMSTFMARVFMDGINPATLKEVSLGFFCHNIGMMKVPVKIMNHGSGLDRASWTLIRQHPGWGLEIMDSLHKPGREMVHIIMEHHERPQGAGYPGRIQSPDIHFFARICAIADAYDALCSQRVYKKPMNPVDALKIMNQQASRGYDAGILSRFAMVMIENGAIR